MNQRSLGVAGELQSRFAARTEDDHRTSCRACVRLNRRKEWLYLDSSLQDVVIPQLAR